MRADIAERERSVGGEGLLHAERPGDERWRLQVGLHATGDEFGSRGNRSCEGDGKAGDFQIREAVGGIEGSVLIGTVAKSVLEVVVHAEASTNDGGSLVVRVAPCEAKARLWEELGIVYGEGGAADIRLGGDDAVGEGVSGGSAVDFVPASGEFIAKTEGEGKVFVDADDVFDISGAEPGAPTERSG